MTRTQYQVVNSPMNSTDSYVEETEMQMELFQDLLKKSREAATIDTTPVEYENGVDLTP